MATRRQFNGLATYKTVCWLALLSIMFTTGFATVQQFPAITGLACSGGISSGLSVNWSQFHFDPSHSGCNPYERVLSPATVASLIPAWHYTTGDGVWSSPAVVNGIVYAGSNDRTLYALNAATGALLWKFATGFVVSSSPAVANGIVYVGSGDEKVYALNARTGASIWSFHTNGEVLAAPAVMNGVVYAASRDNNL